MNAVAKGCEVSWFSALCDDDYEFLGQPDPRLKSSWAHCRDIVLQADTLGFDNIRFRRGMHWASIPRPLPPRLRR